MKKYIISAITLLLVGLAFFLWPKKLKYIQLSPDGEVFEYRSDNKPIDLKEFLPKNDQLTYTYTIENNGTVSEVIYTPSKDIKTFELKIDKISAKNIAKEKISKVSIPIMEQGTLKINKDFYDKYKIHTCEISHYSNNTYYYDALRAGFNILCTTEDKKTSVLLSFEEHIGIISFNAHDGLEKVYGVHLTAINDGNSTVEGEDLY